MDAVTMDSPSWAVATGKYFKYGDNDINTTGVESAIFDTSSKFIYLPADDYKIFTANLNAAAPDFNCYSGQYCFTNAFTCDELRPKMSNLVFTLGD